MTDDTPLARARRGVVHAFSDYVSAVHGSFDLSNFKDLPEDTQRKVLHVITPSEEPLIVRAEFITMEGGGIAIQCVYKRGEAEVVVDWAQTIAEAGTALN